MPGACGNEDDGDDRCDGVNGEDHFDADDRSDAEDEVCRGSGVDVVCKCQAKREQTT